MRNKRFVLDPNIYISYFISRNQNTLAALAIKYKLEFVICDELIAEFRRVLGYPRLARFKIDVKQAVNFVMTLGTNYLLGYPIRRYIPQDENDDYLIALALQSSSGYITSGDNDILSQRKNLERRYKKLKILTKAEFEQMFA
ncbi:MAG TPA: putative toxin-antitoxin system toxin component, PIN family [Mucilaginibacter sp.]|nr:putative toxin-antitoxin system toxin component, PIN family [Mucilaginibacter sp.]